MTPPKARNDLHEYAGNRGITIIEDFVHTTLSAIPTYTPSLNAKNYTLDMASYKSSDYGNKTVIAKGFFVPEKSSRYELELVSNGNGFLFISNDSLSNNKVKSWAFFVII